MKPIVPALAAALVATSAFAAAKATVEVTSGWSRPAVAGTNGVGYLTIVNRGAKADALVGAESPVAERVEMHSMSMAGGVMKMGQVTRVPAPAGAKVEFAPGGYHLMLVGLKKPIGLGDQVPVTLRFASGARVAATLSVGMTEPMN